MLKRETSVRDVTEKRRNFTALKALQCSIITVKRFFLQTKRQKADRGEI